MATAVGRNGKVKFALKAGANPFLLRNNGIEALTLYAFSSENWNRPAQEVSALMELFVWALDSEVKSLHRHNCGELEALTRGMRAWDIRRKR